MNRPFRAPAGHPSLTSNHNSTNRGKPFYTAKLRRASSKFPKKSPAIRDGELANYLSVSKLAFLTSGKTPRSSASSSNARG